MTRELPLDLPLVFFDEHNFPWEIYGDQNKLFEQHLKTGYPQVWSLLKEFENKRREAGGRDEPFVLTEILITNTVLKAPPISPWKKILHEVPAPIENPLREELVDLLKKLVGEINFILDGVWHGKPLEGYCDQCPDRVLTIED